MADVKEETVVIEEDKGITVKLEDVPEEKQPENEVKKKADKPDDREDAIADLKKQLEDQKKAAEAERTARHKAEQYAREQQEVAKTAKSDVEDSNLRVIINAIDATEQAAASAERTYADAMAASDYVAASKAQRAMAQAEAQLLQLNNGKSALEERLKLQKTSANGATQPEIRPVERTKDPVEALAERLTDKSAAWVRAHPSAAQNLNKLQAAHNAAVELEGIEVESPEYFAYIEQRLGMGHTDKPAARKQTVSSAPVSSGSSSSRSSSGNSMTLSAAEVEFAILNEPGLPRDKALEVYARNKAALIKEGKLQ
jgi:hypothetical protein